MHHDARLVGHADEGCARGELGVVHVALHALEAHLALLEVRVQQVPHHVAEDVDLAHRVRQLVVAGQRCILLRVDPEQHLGAWAEGQRLPCEAGGVHPQLQPIVSRRTI
eukprot:3520518-Rhodomonas_salina.2